MKMLNKENHLFILWPINKIRYHNIFIKSTVNILNDSLNVKNKI